MNIRVFAIALVISSPAAAQVSAPAAATAPRASASQPQPIQRSAYVSDMDEEFRKMDADRNGTVTTAEVETFLKAVSLAQAKSRNRAMFAKLDADRNGQLSPAEFANLAASPPKPDPSRVLGRFDLNKDQAITLVEYRTGTLASFDKLDADKDSVVSVAEMRAAGLLK